MYVYGLCQRGGECFEYTMGITGRSYKQNENLSNQLVIVLGASLFIILYALATGGNGSLVATFIFSELH